MKQLILLLFFLNSVTLFAENDTVPPSFKGGNEALFNFINQYIEKEYPNEAKELGIYGDVLLEMSIDSSTHINSVKVIDGIGGGCDEEAVRILRLSEGQWNAGKINNTPATYTGYLIVRFSLDDKNPHFKYGDQNLKGFQLKIPAPSEKKKKR